MFFGKSENHYLFTQLIRYAHALLTIAFLTAPSHALLSATRFMCSLVARRSTAATYELIATSPLSLEVPPARIALKNGTNFSEELSQKNKTKLHAPPSTSFAELDRVIPRLVMLPPALEGRLRPPLRRYGLRSARRASRRRSAPVIGRRASSPDADVRIRSRPLFHTHIKWRQSYIIVRNVSDKLLSDKVCAKTSNNINNTIFTCGRDCCCASRLH